MNWFRSSGLAEDTLMAWAEVLSAFTVCAIVLVLLWRAC